MTNDARPALLRFFAIHHRLALLFGAAALFYLLTRLSGWQAAQHFRTSLLLLAALSGLYLLYRKHVCPRADSDLPGRFFAMVWIGVCLLYALLSSWNHLFLQHVVASGYRRDVFRPVFHTFYAPIYGLPETSPLWVWALAAAVLAALLLGGIRLSRAAIRTGSYRRLLPALMVAQLVLISGFAATQGSERLLENTYDYAAAASTGNMDRFASLGAVWSQWNEKMQEMRGRDRHYPPGHLFMLKLESRLGMPGGYKGLIILLTVSCTPLLFWLISATLADKPTALLGAALFAASSGPLILPTTAVSPLTMFFGLAALLLLVHGVRGNRIAAAASGVVMAIYSLFSFTVFISGLLLALFLVVSVLLRRVRWQRAIATALVAGGSFVSCLLLVHLVLGFNAPECIHIAISQNYGSMTSTPFDEAVRYLLRSSGNVLAYLVFAGSVLSVAAVIGMRFSLRAPGLFAALGVGLGLTLVLAAFSTLFFMETERIWVFLTPALAAMAAWGVRSAVAPEGFRAAGMLLVAATLSTSIAQELVFLHYWP